MSVAIATSRHFFPLDRKLKLRADQWSPGAVRVAVRQGLQAQSFKLAAEAFSDAIGSNMSRESMRSVTQGWGKVVNEKREAAAEAVFNLQREADEVVSGVVPIKSQASLSTDGGMVHIRGEGWKEVKLVTISAVRPKKESEKGTHPDGRRYQPYEPQMMLEKHSYQAGWWDADEMGKHQYLEGLRRQLPHCNKASSTNDGASWIERITAENFPQLIQIVDWFHATEKMWFIAKSIIRDQQARDAWVNDRLDDLWWGRLADVQAALDKLDTSQALQPDEVDTAIGYFQRQQHRMHYPQYRIAGYPIGSGAVESGVNNVVHHRLKRQGQGWHPSNVNPMLAALSELHSDRFQLAWAATQ